MGKVKDNLPLIKKDCEHVRYSSGQCKYCLSKKGGSE